MAHRRNDDDADVETFERYLDSLENGPFTTEFERLTSAGLELPHPDSLTDEQLTRKLWEVIHALARMRAFITSTDHLRDRELYIRWWTDVLHDEVPVEDFGHGTWHVDLVSTGSQENLELWSKYMVVVAMCGKPSCLSSSPNMAPAARCSPCTHAVLRRRNC